MKTERGDVLLKNRWSYTSIYEKRQFSFTVFLISSTVLLEFILIGAVSRAVSRQLNNYFSLLFNENSLIYRFFSSLSDEEFHMLGSNIVSTLTLWISFSISSAVLIFFLRRVKSKGDFNINNRVSFKFKMPENALMLMLLGLAIMYLFGSISILFDSFLGSFGIEKPIYESVAFPRTAFGIIMYFFALVVSPAILEEFFCRYLILNALRKYGDGFAIAVSSIFFGLLHGRTNAFFFATAIGFFLAYFAIKTQSIWFPIILHAFVNFMALFWHLIADLAASEGLFDLISWSFWTVLFGISVIYIIFVIVKKKDLSLSRRKDYIQINPGRKTFVFFNMATIIFIILALMRSAGEYIAL
jgi:membrane protease YdiL (CAAX protease family)